MIEITEDRAALLAVPEENGLYVPVFLQAESGDRMTTLLGAASGAGVAGLHNLHRHLLAQPGTVSITRTVCEEMGVTDDAVAVAWDTDGHIWALRASLAPLAAPVLPILMLHRVASGLPQDALEWFSDGNDGDKICRVPFPPKVRMTLQKAVARWSKHMK